MMTDQLGRLPPCNNGVPHRPAHSCKVHCSSFTRQNVAKSSLRKIQADAVSTRGSITNLRDVQVLRDISTDAPDLENLELRDVKVSNGPCSSAGISTSASDVLVALTFCSLACMAPSSCSVV